MSSIDHQVLNKEFKSKDHKESGVVKQGCENVDLVGIDHPAVDLVEKIHKDECVEANSVQHKTVSWHSELISNGLCDGVEAGFKEDEGASIHQEEHDKDLEECLTENLSPAFG